MPASGQASATLRHYMVPGKKKCVPLNTKHPITTINHSGRFPRTRQIHTCSICARSFQRLRGLRQHERSKHHPYLTIFGKIAWRLPDGSLPCTHCGCKRSFRSEPSWKDHHKWHIVRRFQVLIRFFYYSYLPNQNPRVFECHECRLTYSYMSGLCQHRRRKHPVQVRLICVEHDSMTT